MVIAADGLRSGTSSGGTSDRKLDVVTWLGFGIPILIYLWFLHHYSLNVVHADQWSDVSLIGASYDGHLNLSALWAQHNENRILFPNLIVLAMSRLDAFNISAEEYLSAVFLLAAVALIVAAHKRRSPGRRLLAYCPVVILMLSIVQAENTLWGFQLAWYLVLVALAGVLFLLDRHPSTLVGVVGAVILAVIGSYSSFQGLLIWPAGLVVLLYRGRPRRVVVAWLTAGVLTTALYFFRFDTHAAVRSNLTPIHLPGRAVRYFFESIGDVLGVPLSPRGPGADLVAVVGGLIFVLALVTLWWGVRHRDSESAAPIGMALTVFGLLFAVSTTYGRAWAGPAAASASRYTTYDLLILVGTYLTFIAVRPGRDSSPGSSRAAPRVFAVLLGCVITMVALFGFVNGIRWARSSHQSLLTAAAATVDIDHLPGPVAQRWLEPSAPPGLLRYDAHVLAAHGLSFYSDAQAVAQYRRLAAMDTAAGLFHYTQPPPTQVELPVNGSVVSGRALLVASAAEDLQPAQVDFVVSGGSVPPRMLVAKETSLGWAALWITSTVPNGRYELTSLVHGRSGVTTTSHPVQVVVRNR